jgi:3-oxoacyl-(acyl-carrier-protein) synthase
VSRQRIKGSSPNPRFINTVAGWVNLLLMSASGPVKIPVGAWSVLGKYLWA